ncbi:MAG: DUF3459 domain-containing protein [Microbacterium chocolatum]|nr:DUF3459 domain-containing protein [Microbacterium chocolatum]
MRVGGDATGGEVVAQFYRRLIALRHDDPVVQTGAFTLVWPEDTEVYAFHRAQDGIRLTLVANCSSDTVERDAAELRVEGASVVIANHDDPPQAPSGRLRLRPWECVVYRVEESAA